MSPANLQFIKQTPLYLHLNTNSPDYYNDTYCAHAVDLIKSQLKQLLVTAFRHQFQCRLQEAWLILEQQGSYVSNTLKKRERETDLGGGKMN